MSKRTIAVLFLLGAGLAPLPAWAQTREEVMQSSARCAAISDDRLWLDCYYGAAQPMRAKLGLAPAPANQQSLVSLSARAATPQATLPAPQAVPPARRPGLLDRVIAFASPQQQKAEAPTRMTSFRFDAAGYFTVELANGETWRQSQGDAARARWRKTPQSYVVTILPGQSDTGRTMKVANDQVYAVEQVTKRP